VRFGDLAEGAGIRGSASLTRRIAQFRQGSGLARRLPLAVVALLIALLAGTTYFARAHVITVDGTGRDYLWGGAGRDLLITRDKKRGNDRVRGGSGADLCRTDFVRVCP
jgi:Ca2+-binding RTX toxin-like protein